MFALVANNYDRGLEVRNLFATAADAFDAGDALLKHATAHNQSAAFDVYDENRVLVTTLCNYEVTPEHKCVIQETPDGMGCVTCLYT